MTVYINNEANEIESSASLQKALQHFNSFNIAFGTAIAVNNKVVSKNDWQNYLLKENDKIIVIRASQGG